MPKNAIGLGGVAILIVIGFAKENVIPKFNLFGLPFLPWRFALFEAAKILAVLTAATRAIAAVSKLSIN